jgi:hypothetical protein
LGRLRFTIFKFTAFDEIIPDSRKVVEPKAANEPFEVDLLWRLEQPSFQAAEIPAADEKLVPDG